MDSTANNFAICMGMEMDIEKIITLINTVSESKITEFHLKDEHFQLRLSKTENQINPNNDSIILSKSVESHKSEIGKENEKTQKIDDENKNVTNDTSLDVSNIVEIKSPIVGTFYSAASPEDKDFVSVGDKIKKGQIVCIIEAMKLLNDIESDYEGEIVEVLVKNEQMVEFNQPLFRIHVKG